MTQTYVPKSVLFMAFLLISKKAMVILLIMPNKCCIPSCQSSLEKKTIHVFRFPSEKTEREERGKWFEVVKTNVENFKLGSNTVI